jgi:hypothetical protein
MLGLARLAMRGPLAASLLVAATALLALLFAPALFVSGALLGLVTLRHGVLAGGRVALIAGAICVAALLIVAGRLGAAAVAIAAAWLPVWGAAQSLRRTGRQGMAVANLGFCVAGYAALMRWANPDVGAFWRERLGAFGAVIEDEGGQFLSQAEIAKVAELMHPASVAVLLICLIGTLLLARWWQAGLYNPGGFRQEFQLLALPRWLAPAGAVAAAASLVLAFGSGAAGLAGDLVIVLMILFSLQGLAVIHASCRAKALHTGWLIGVYVLLGFVPHIVVPILAAAGIADTVGNFRARLPRSE